MVASSLKFAPIHLPAQLWPPFLKNKLFCAATGLGACPIGGPINIYYSDLLMTPLSLKLLRKRAYGLSLYGLSIAECLIWNRYSVDFVD